MRTDIEAHEVRMAPTRLEEQLVFGAAALSADLARVELRAPVWAERRGADGTVDAIALAYTEPAQLRRVAQIYETAASRMEALIRAQAASPGAPMG